MTLKVDYTQEELRDFLTTLRFLMEKSDLAELNEITELIVNMEDGTIVDISKEVKENREANMGFLMIAISAIATKK